MGLVANIPYHFSSPYLRRGFHGQSDRFATLYTMYYLQWQSAINGITYQLTLSHNSR